jgi:hypothetical protein
MTTSMTASMTTARAERMHPDWCDLGPECKREGSDPVGPHNRRHAGRVTAFYPERDDYRIELRLEHDEDRHPGTGVDRGSPDVVLSLLSEGAMQADGTPFFASVALSAEDARFLARQLEDYARRVKHNPLWMPESEFTWSGREVQR